MDPTVLFNIINESQCTIQLIYLTFFYTFNKKFSISAKLAVPNGH